MNIAFLLQPKSDTAFLYDDFTLRQGLEKMRHHGYTAIPVIDREGKYITTIRQKIIPIKVSIALAGPEYAGICRG